MIQDNLLLNRLNHESIIKVKGIYKVKRFDFDYIMEYEDSYDLNYIITKP